MEIGIRAEARVSTEDSVGFPIRFTVSRGVLLCLKEYCSRIYWVSEEAVQYLPRTDSPQQQRIINLR